MARTTIASIFFNGFSLAIRHPLGDSIATAKRLGQNTDNGEIGLAIQAVKTGHLIYKSLPSSCEVG